MIIASRLTYQATIRCQYEQLVKENRDQQRKYNELPGIHRRNVHVCAYPPKYLFIFRADTSLFLFILFFKIQFCIFSS